MKPDILSNAILRCLKIIDKEGDYPRQISKNITQRVSQTTHLVNRMKVGIDIYNNRTLIFIYVILI